MKHLRESLRVFFLGLLLLLLFPVSFADELPPAEETVRFGFLKPMDVYGKNNYQPGETDIRRPLERYLQKTLPDIHFDFVEYRLADLGKVAQEHTILTSR